MRGRPYSKGRTARDRRHPTRSGRYRHHDHDHGPDLRWFAEHDLPGDLIEYPAAGLRGSLTRPGGVTFHDWS
ncbi:hypothetical protein [Streptomyces sp. NPDC060184]|uniref:hypothetical protein n=1 Tax=Streptomyces sp. NPDC060184 TaxID=3347064 RepID=UPI0036598256